MTEIALDAAFARRRPAARSGQPRSKSPSWNFLWFISAAPLERNSWARRPRSRPQSSGNRRTNRPVEKRRPKCHSKSAAPQADRIFQIDSDQHTGIQRPSPVARTVLNPPWHRSPTFSPPDDGEPARIVVAPRNPVGITVFRSARQSNRGVAMRCGCPTIDFAVDRHAPPPRIEYIHLTGRHRKQRAGLAP